MLGFLPLLFPEVVAPVSAYPPYCVHGGPSATLYAESAYGPVALYTVESGAPDVLYSVVNGAPNPLYLVAQGPLTEC